jgi:hypothetical protein
MLFGIARHLLTTHLHRRHNTYEHTTRFSCLLTLQSLLNRFPVHITSQYMTGSGGHVLWRSHVLFYGPMWWSRSVLEAKANT